MRIAFSALLFCHLISYGEIKLEEIPRLDTSTALKILAACHQESLSQKVEVAIMIVGIDVRHAVFIDNDFSGRTEALDWVFGGVASRAG